MKPAISIRIFTMELTNSRELMFSTRSKSPDRPGIFQILGHGAGILGHSMTEMKATGA